MTTLLTACVPAVLAGVGAHLVLTELLGAPRLRSAQTHRPSASERVRTWSNQAGLSGIPIRQLAAVVVAVAGVGLTAGIVVFGAPLPALVLAGFGATLPVAAWRQRRQNHLAAAQEAWPRMIEEIRVLTGSGGRSVPQAIFEAAGHAPPELRSAFAEARRTWQITTDLDRTLTVLKDALADPTADAAAETLLVAHELGGSDLDGRLAALAEDRRLDTQCRKDARARQAGARFARRFVLAVPFGMAAVGLTIGQGRQAYTSAGGQVAVVVALLAVVACWWWSGRILRLPPERRVFTR